LAGIKDWFGLRVAASDVQLWECTIFYADDETHLLFSCLAAAVARRERQFLLLWYIT
jgi:hypothetical protein